MFSAKRISDRDSYPLAALISELLLTSRIIRKEPRQLAEVPILYGSYLFELQARHLLIRNHLL